MHEQTYASDPLRDTRQTMSSPETVSLQNNRRIQEEVFANDPLAGERRDTLGVPDYGTARR